MYEIYCQRHLHKVVIIGAGFGGLAAAGKLKSSNVHITLIDKQNHHLFQPLLYQVAGASLSPADIAWPVRQIFERSRNVRSLMAEVVGIDKLKRLVNLSSGAQIPYDSLIVATGSKAYYFGNDAWKDAAQPLKCLDHAIQLRDHILESCERAEHTSSASEQAALLTFAVVGGGPTGVETAGTLAELMRKTLRHDFRRIDPASSRVVLIEAGPRLLSTFSKKLSQYAESALEELGVEVFLNASVQSIDAEGLTFGGKTLPSKNVIWAAGVRASAAAQWLQVSADKMGRIVVKPDLSIPGHPEVFVIGDTAAIMKPDGDPIPGLAPAAKQAGKYVANVIKARLNQDSPPQPFEYKHMGSLATIGKKMAVADFERIHFKGTTAWWLWKLVHLSFLVDARSRLQVSINWLWDHFLNDRGSRLIIKRKHPLRKPRQAGKDSSEQ